jgi:hypothetical protein
MIQHLASERAALQVAHFKKTPSQYKTWEPTFAGVNFAVTSEDCKIFVFVVLI